MTDRKLNLLQGWILIAAVSALAVGLWRLAMVVHAATPPVFARADHLAFAGVLSLGAVALVGLALRLERAPVRSIGLARPVAALEGALWWLVPALAGLGIALALGWGRIELLAAPAEAVGKFAALVALVFLSEALPEELIFRGWLQSRLTSRLGPWGGVLGQAALFTAFAVIIGAAPDPMQASFIAAFGVALGVLRAATGSLWAPIGFHLVFMTVQQGHGGGWDLIALDLPEMTRMLILAQIPFALVIALRFGQVARARAT